MFKKLIIAFIMALLCYSASAMEVLQEYYLREHEGEPLVQKYCPGIFTDDCAKYVVDSILDTIDTGEAIIIGGDWDNFVIMSTVQHHLDGYSCFRWVLDSEAFEYYSEESLRRQREHHT